MLKAYGTSRYSFSSFETSFIKFYNILFILPVLHGIHLMDPFIYGNSQYQSVNVFYYRGNVGNGNPYFATVNVLKLCSTSD